jgi:superfamily I DNA/RNA helicase
VPARFGSTTNYRNGANILQAAEEVRRVIPDEDLDDTMIPAGDVAAAREGGDVIDFEAPTTGALEVGLVGAVRTFVDHGGAAVLCRNHREAAEYMRVLRRERLLVDDLEKYAGISSHAVKVGVFLRSKGFDFKAVFIPRYDLAFADASEMKVGGDRAGRPAILLYVAMTRARDLLWRGGLSGTPGYGRNGEAGTL